MRRFGDSANDCLETFESSCVRTICRDSKASRSLHRRRKEGAKHCLDGCLEVFRGVPYSVGLFLPARYLTFPNNLIVASLKYYPRPKMSLNLATSGTSACTKGRS